MSFSPLWTRELTQTQFQLQLPACVLAMLQLVTPLHDIALSNAQQDAVTGVDEDYGLSFK